MSIFKNGNDDRGEKKDIGPLRPGGLISSTVLGCSPSSQNKDAYCTELLKSFHPMIDLFS